MCFTSTIPFWFISYLLLMEFITELLSSVVSMLQFALHKLSLLLVWHCSSVSFIHGWACVSQSVLCQTYPRTAVRVATQDSSFAEATLCEISQEDVQCFWATRGNQWDQLDKSLASAISRS